MQKYIVTACILSIAVVSAYSQIEGENGLPLIGTIQPKFASDITASNWSIGAETMDRDYTIYNNWKKYLGPLGFKKARLQAGWAKTEPQPGVYRFDWLDEIVFDMVAQGVEPWMCLCYGNTLYPNGGQAGLGASLPQSEESLAAWQRWVALVVVRYRDHIDEWEIWNEPNQGKNDPKVYTSFFIETAETIRSIQPGAKILGLSLAGVDIEYTDAVLAELKQRNALHLLDEITYHPYQANPHDSYPKVAQLRETIAKYSLRIQIRQGENGAPSERRKTKALKDIDWTEHSQAKWALRRLLGDLGHDIPSSYFAIVDMKYPDEMNRKGLLYSNGDQTVAHAKPSYLALQNLAAIFDNRLERIPQYSYETNCMEPHSLFAFRNRFTQIHAVAIWLDGKVPSDHDEYLVKDFVLNNAKFENPVYVDLLTGKVYDIPFERFAYQGTAYHFKRMPIYDSPIVIINREMLDYKKTP